MDPDALLDSLNPVGWKLGLERMRLLSDELGRPQDSFDSIHVVGTNGKTSVTRMIAAIVTAHGRRTGCTISPHVNHWSERVLVEGRELDRAGFTSAVERAAEAARAVNSRLADGDEVTQFELATAASFVALAEAGVELAVIEAGLGGRLDATNTIPSLATVLTSIALDHTEYLGETELDIAAEKLAVLRPGSVLVLGKVAPEVEELARRTATVRDCRVVIPDGEGPVPGLPGDFQRRNLTLARAAAATWLGKLDPAATGRAERDLVIPGRLELIAENPPTCVDVAHNRAGAAALARALPEVAGGRPVVACIAVLGDKDAAGMLAELAGAVDRAVFTTLPAGILSARGRPGARAHDPADLMRLAADAGLPGEVLADPVAAIARARSLAADAGGIALVAGSHFLLAAGFPS